MSLPVWHGLRMPRAYALDLRERRLRAKAAGVSAVEIEQLTGVSASASTVHRWQRRVDGGGSLVPRHAPGRALRIGAAQEDALRGQVRRPPGCNPGRALCPLGDGPRRAGEPSDDVPSAHPARPPAQKKSLIATERTESARAAWRRAMAAHPAHRLVFLDETSTQTVMTRSRARAPRGKRVVGRVPRHHGSNITCLAALTPAGIRAPLVFPGALDGTIFVQWLRDRRLPTLAPGTTIVLDTLRVHRTAAARAVIEAAGCRLRFLPASSPDGNPLELAFAKLKTHLRGVASRAYDTLVTAIGEGFNRITAADAEAWYRHCGYHVTGPPPDQSL